MAGVEQALATLRDVEGIVGSFVLTTNGELLGKSLPAIYPEPYVVEAGARIARLIAAMSENGATPSACTLRYAEHKLLVKASSEHLVVAVALADVNMAQARVGLNLIARQLQGLGSLPESRPTHPPSRPHPQGAPEAKAEPARSSRPLFFRGKRVG
jgi:hypothetical protein